MSVAKSYAKALYEAAQTPNGDGKRGAELLNELEAQMDAYTALVHSSRELEMVLNGPVTTMKEKMAVVTEVAKKAGYHKLFSEFLALLARKGRLVIFTEVREAFLNVRLAAEGGTPGQVIAADSIDETDVAGLAKAFTHKLGRKVSFRVSTDPSLLAGMKVTVNGVTYDGTLRSQLQRLRDQVS